MGLLSAAIGAVGGALADTWKDWFYCESLDKDTLMVKGEKMIGNRSSNKKGNDNIISNGSGIVVADGQCMIIVDQGKVVEICAEPGEFTYDTSSEPSLFAGKLGDSIKETFQLLGKRIAYGGDTGHDQRVYYFNTKEILDNKFGTPNPIPFRVVDKKIDLDLDVSLRCSGIYSYKIADPIRFYTNIAGNVSDVYTKDQIADQLKAEFISALQPAFGQISALELRPNEIITHNKELEQAMNIQLSNDWGDKRGLAIVSIALGSVTLPEEDQEIIKQTQRGAALANANLAAGVMAGATASAMEKAASNEGGAMNGFVGLGMAANAGGNNVANLFAAGAAQQQQQQQQQAAGATSWTCQCGQVNSGNFCSACGTKKPEQAAGGFCPNCGKPVQAGARFCANCGNQLQ